jgi:thioredoxin-like negative regulator of GroEL
MLNQALSRNDDFAEAHLVYGNLYEATDDIESAIESWRYAASFTDSPEWVQREVNLKLSQHASETPDAQQPDSQNDNQEN